MGKASYKMAKIIKDTSFATSSYTNLPFEWLALLHFRIAVWTNESIGCYSFFCLFHIMDHKSKPLYACV